MHLPDQSGPSRNIARLQFSFPNSLTTDFSSQSLEQSIEPVVIILLASCSSRCDQESRRLIQSQLKQQSCNFQRLHRLSAWHLRIINVQLSPIWTCDKLSKQWYQYLDSSPLCPFVRRLYNCDSLKSLYSSTFVELCLSP